MKPRPNSFPAAQALIKRFESFHANAVQEPDGRWVVGYGHRAAAKSGVNVTEAEASLLLIYDVMQAEKAIDDVATATLKQHQRDALICFVHGIGAPAFRGSDVARYLYEGRAKATAEAITAHGDGQFDRRDAESSLFLKDPQAATPERGEDHDDPLVEIIIKVEHPAEFDDEAYDDVVTHSPDVESLETVDLTEVKSEPSRDVREDSPGELLDPVAALVKRVEADTAPAAPPTDLSRTTQPVEVAFEEPPEEPPHSDERPESAEPGAVVVETSSETTPELTPETITDHATPVESSDPAPSSPPPMPLVPTGILEAEDEISRILETAQNENSNPVIEHGAVEDDAAAQVETDLREEQTSSEATSEQAPIPAESESDPEGESSRRRLVTGSPLDGLLGGAPTRIPAPVTRPAASEVAERPAKTDHIAAPMPQTDPVEEAIASFSPPSDAVVTEQEIASNLEIEDEDDPTSRLIARMAVQISGVAPVVEEPEIGTAEIVAADLELPDGVSVGYVLAGGMLAQLDAAEAEEIEAAAPARAAPIASDELNGTRTGTGASISDLANSDGDTLAQLAVAMRDVDRSATDVDVETGVELSTVNDDEMADGNSSEVQPPHPSENPARSHGAVGEITGTKSLVDDVLLDQAEEFSGVTDDKASEFAPHDLAGKPEPFTDAEVDMKEYKDNGFGFMAVMLAGLVLTAWGGFDVYNNLEIYREPTDVTAGIAALSGGLFLFVAATIQLIGVLTRKRPEKSKS